MRCACDGSRHYECKVHALKVDGHHVQVGIPSPLSPNANLSPDAILVEPSTRHSVLPSPDKSGSGKEANEDHSMNQLDGE